MVVRGESTDEPDPDATSAAVTVIAVDASLPEGTDVAAAVESAAGTVVERLGGLGDWTSVSIRGSTMRQVLVCLDGVPLNPDGASAINLSELPLRSFSRIEVYRGNAPPSLASAAMGGVINLVSPTEGAPPEFSLSAGQLGTGRLHATASSKAAFLAIDGFTTDGAFTHYDDRGTRYNALDDRVSLRRNNDTHQLATHGRLRLGGDQLRVTVLDAFVARDEGIPGPTGFPTDTVRYGVVRNLVVGDVEGGTARLRARFRAWSQLREERLDDREGEIGVGAQWTRDTHTTLGTRAHLAWIPGSVVVASLDADLRHDRYRARDRLTETVADPRSRWGASVAASAALRSHDERWALFPVLQASASGEVVALSPRLGVLARPIEGLTLKGNVGRYFRPPDFVELYGDRGAIVGNPDLVPEHGWQADLGTRITLPENPAVAGTIELTHFINDATDLVVFVQNAQHTAMPHNLGSARIRGIEAALSLDLLDALGLHSSLTRTWSENRSTEPAYAGNKLPRLPDWELHHTTSLRPITGLRLGHTLSFTDGNFWDATNWFATPPRLLHGVFFQASAPKGWSVAVHVLNLTDRVSEEVLRNPLDPADSTEITQPITDFIGYPLPGRTLVASVRWAPEVRRAP